MAMPLGLTRKEQWALLGTIGVIVGAIGIRSYQQQPGSGMVYAEGQGYWKRLPVQEAKRTPAASSTPPTPSTQSALSAPSAPPAPQPKPAAQTPLPLAAQVPAPASSAPAKAESKAAPKAPAASAGLSALAASPLDINAATAQQLEALPGIGPVKAAAIVATRQRLGRYTNVDQLEAVSGIGPATMTKIRPYVRVGP